MLDLGADAQRVREEVITVLGPLRGGGTPGGRGGRWRRPRAGIGSVTTQHCWQYRVERRDAVDEQQLNDLGAEGWELVSVERTADWVELIFKRRGPVPGSLRAAG